MSADTKMYVLLINLKCTTVKMEKFMWVIFNCSCVERLA